FQRQIVVILIIVLDKTLLQIIYGEGLSMKIRFMKWQRNSKRKCIFYDNQMIRCSDIRPKRKCGIYFMTLVHSPEIFGISKQRPTWAMEPKKNPIYSKYPLILLIK